MDQPGQAEGAGRLGRESRLLTPERRFQPVGRLGRILGGLFIAWVVLGALDIAFRLQERGLLRKLERDPSSVTIGELTTSDDRIASLGVLMLVAYVVTAFLFIWWLRRAYGNLPALEGPRRFGPGWAIGAWFVPILNFWRPYQIVDETWVGSEPVRAHGLPEKRPAHMRAWWACFLLSGLTVRLGVTGDDAVLSDFLRANLMEIVSAVLTIASAVFAWRLVGDISERQRRRAAQVGGG